MTEAFSYFFMSWTDPYLLFLTAAGTFAGIYIGAIPGFTSPVSIVLVAALALTVLSQTSLWGKITGTGKRAGGYAQG